jgi:TP901-1 family phage major tail protein
MFGLFVVFALLSLLLYQVLQSKRMQPTRIIKHGRALNLQFFAVTLPDNPSASAAAVGKDFLLYVNTGTVDTPVWTLVGGQRNSSLGRTADSIDTSHKTSGGWKSSKAGLRGWSIDLDALVLLQDLGVEALETAFMQGKEINVKFERPDKKYYTGWASITDFSIDPPHDGEASLSGTLEGNGALSDLTTPTAG